MVLGLFAEHVEAYDLIGVRMRTHSNIHIVLFYFACFIAFAHHKQNNSHELYVNANRIPNIKFMNLRAHSHCVKQKNARIAKFPCVQFMLGVCLPLAYANFIHMKHTLSVHFMSESLNGNEQIIWNDIELVVCF